MSQWAISAAFCVFVSWLAVDAQPEDLTMTIPTVVETHWLNTMPLIHELQGIHDQGMEDWLELGQMPAPIAPPIAYVETQQEAPGLLERLVAWMLGPRP